jgi:16S rRNA processing protein RimM
MAPESAEDPPFPADAVEVARVLGAWGVKGAIRLHPYSSDPQALFSSRRWFVIGPAAPGGSPGSDAPTDSRAVSAALPVYPTVLRVSDARAQGGDVVAAVREIQDRDAAQALKGARVFVSRASFPTPQTDEFYWVDLIGLAVVNREGVTLGVVDSLFETGANAVMRIRSQSPEAASPAGRERLVPFVAAHVDRVDLAARLILVDWDADF